MKSNFNNFLIELHSRPFAYAIVLFLSFITYQYLFIGQSVELMTPLDEFPEIVKGYKAEEITDMNWPFKQFRGDQQLRRLYKHPSNIATIGVAISYFSKQTQDHEVINQSLMWLHHKAEKIDIDVGKSIIQVNRGIARGIETQSYKDDKRLFYFFYYVNRKVLTNPYRVKWENLLSMLFKGRSDAALVVFTIENKDTSTVKEIESAKQFMRASIPIVLNLISQNKK